MFNKFCKKQLWECSKELTAVFSSPFTSTLASLYTDVIPGYSETEDWESFTVGSLSLTVTLITAFVIKPDGST